MFVVLLLLLMLLEFNWDGNVVVASLICVVVVVVVDDGDDVGNCGCDVMAVVFVSVSEDSVVLVVVLVIVDAVISFLMATNDSSLFDSSNPFRLYKYIFRFLAIRLWFVGKLASLLLLLLYFSVIMVIFQSLIPLGNFDDSIQ